LSPMFRPLVRYADFRGRSTRSEFLLFWLLLSLVTLASVSLGVVVDNATDVSGNEVMFVILNVFYLAVTVPWLAVVIRRLHDVDKSGWWLLAAFIPFGIVVLFNFWARDGTRGSNRYGPDPKSRMPLPLDEDGHPVTNPLG